MLATFDDMAAKLQLVEEATPPPCQLHATLQSMNVVAERGFDPRTFGLRAQRANHCATPLLMPWGALGAISERSLHCQFREFAQLRAGALLPCFARVFLLATCGGRSRRVELRVGGPVPAAPMV